MDDEIIGDLLMDGAEIWTDQRNPMPWPKLVGDVQSRAYSGSEYEWPWPDYLNERSIVFRSDKSGYHGEVLPKWGIRAYNVIGELRGLTMARVQASE